MSSSGHGGKKTKNQSSSLSDELKKVKGFFQKFQSTEKDKKDKKSFQFLSRICDISIDVFHDLSKEEKSDFRLAHHISSSENQSSDSINEEQLLLTQTQTAQTLRIIYSKNSTHSFRQFQEDLLPLMNNLVEMINQKHKISEIFVEYLTKAYVVSLKRKELARVSKGSSSMKREIQAQQKSTLVTEQDMLHSLPSFLKVIQVFLNEIKSESYSIIKPLKTKNPSRFFQTFNENDLFLNWISREQKQPKKKKAKKQKTDENSQKFVFLPSLIEIMIAMIDPFSDNVEILEDLFVTLMYFFKHSSGPFEKEIGYWYLKFIPLLVHEKFYVRDFAAQAFSFLVSGATQKQQTKKAQETGKNLLDSFLHDLFAIISSPEVVENVDFVWNDFQFCYAFYLDSICGKLFPETQINELTQHKKEHRYSFKGFFLKKVAAKLSIVLEKDNLMLLEESLKLVYQPTFIKQMAMQRQALLRTKASILKVFGNEIETEIEENNEIISKLQTTLFGSSSDIMFHVLAGPFGRLKINISKTVVNSLWRQLDYEKQHQISSQKQEFSTEKALDLTKKKFYCFQRTVRLLVDHFHDPEASLEFWELLEPELNALIKKWMNKDDKEMDRLYIGTQIGFVFNVANGFAERTGKTPMDKFFSLLENLLLLKVVAEKKPKLKKIEEKVSGNGENFPFLPFETYAMTMQFIVTLLSLSARSQFVEFQPKIMNLIWNKFGFEIVVPQQKSENVQKITKLVFFDAFHTLILNLKLQDEENVYAQTHEKENFSKISGIFNNSQNGVFKIFLQMLNEESLQRWTLYLLLSMGDTFANVILSKELTEKIEGMFSNQILNNFLNHEVPVSKEQMKPELVAELQKMWCYMSIISRMEPENKNDLIENKILKILQFFSSKSVFSKLYENKSSQEDQTAMKEFDCFDEEMKNSASAAPESTISERIQDGYCMVFAECLKIVFNLTTSTKQRIFSKFIFPIIMDSISIKFFYGHLNVLKAIAQFCEYFYENQIFLHEFALENINSQNSTKLQKQTEQDKLKDQETIEKMISSFFFNLKFNLSSTNHLRRMRTLQILRSCAKKEILNLHFSAIETVQGREQEKKIRIPTEYHRILEYLIDVEGSDILLTKLRQKTNAIDSLDSFLKAVEDGHKKDNEIFKIPKEMVQFLTLYVFGGLSVKISTVTDKLIALAKTVSSFHFDVFLDMFFKQFLVIFKKKLDINAEKRRKWAEGNEEKTEFAGFEKEKNGKLLKVEKKLLDFFKSEQNSVLESKITPDEVFDDIYGMKEEKSRKQDKMIEDLFESCWKILMTSPEMKKYMISENPIAIVRLFNVFIEEEIFTARKSLLYRENFFDFDEKSENSEYENPPIVILDEKMPETRRIISLIALIQNVDEKWLESFIISQNDTHVLRMMCNILKILRSTNLNVQKEAFKVLQLTSKFIFHQKSPKDDENSSKFLKILRNQLFFLKNNDEFSFSGLIDSAMVSKKNSGQMSKLRQELEAFFGILNLKIQNNSENVPQKQIEETWKRFEKSKSCFVKFLLEKIILPGLILPQKGKKMSIGKKGSASNAKKERNWKKYLDEVILLMQEGSGINMDNNSDESRFVHGLRMFSRDDLAFFLGELMFPILTFDNESKELITMEQKLLKTNQNTQKLDSAFLRLKPRVNMRVFSVAQSVFGTIIETPERIKKFGIRNAFKPFFNVILHGLNRIISVKTRFPEFDAYVKSVFSKEAMKIEEEPEKEEELVEKMEVEDDLNKKEEVAEKKEEEIAKKEEEKSKLEETVDQKTIEDLEKQEVGKFTTENAEEEKEEEEVEIIEEKEEEEVEKESESEKEEEDEEEEENDNDEKKTEENGGNAVEDDDEQFIVSATKQSKDDEIFKNIILETSNLKIIKRNYHSIFKLSSKPIKKFFSKYSSFFFSELDKSFAKGLLSNWLFFFETYSNRLDLTKNNKFVAVDDGLLSIIFSFIENENTNYILYLNQEFSCQNSKPQILLLWILETFSKLSITKMLKTHFNFVLRILTSISRKKNLSFKSKTVEDEQMPFGMEIEPENEQQSFILKDFIIKPIINQIISCFYAYFSPINDKSWDFNASARFERLIQFFEVIRECFTTETVSSPEKLLFFYTHSLEAILFGKGNYNRSIYGSSLEVFEEKTQNVDNQKMEIEEAEKDENFDQDEDVDMEKAAKTEEQGEDKVTVISKQTEIEQEKFIAGVIQLFSKFLPTSKFNLKRNCIIIFSKVLLTRTEPFLIDLVCKFVEDISKFQQNENSDKQDFAIQTKYLGNLAEISKVIKLMHQTKGMENIDNNLLHEAFLKIKNQSFVENFSYLETGVILAASLSFFLPGKSKKNTVIENSAAEAINSILKGKLNETKFVSLVSESDNEKEDYNSCKRIVIDTIENHFATRTSMNHFGGQKRDNSAFFQASEYFKQLTSLSIVFDCLIQSFPSAYNGFGASKIPQFFTELSSSEANEQGSISVKKMQTLESFLASFDKKVPGNGEKFFKIFSPMVLFFIDHFVQEQTFLSGAFQFFEFATHKDEAKEENDDEENGNDDETDNEMNTDLQRVAAKFVEYQNALPKKEKELKRKVFELSQKLLLTFIKKTLPWKFVERLLSYILNKVTSLSHVKASQFAQYVEGRNPFISSAPFMLAKRDHYIDLFQKMISSMQKRTFTNQKVTVESYFEEGVEEIINLETPKYKISNYLNKFVILKMQNLLWDKYHRASFVNMRVASVLIELFHFLEILSQNITAAREQKKRMVLKIVLDLVGVIAKTKREGFDPKPRRKAKNTMIHIVSSMEFGVPYLNLILEILCARMNEGFKLAILMDCLNSIFAELINKQEERVKAFFEKLKNVSSSNKKLQQTEKMEEDKEENAENQEVELKAQELKQKKYEMCLKFNNELQVELTQPVEASLNKVLPVLLKDLSKSAAKLKKKETKEKAKMNDFQAIFRIVGRICSLVDISTGVKKILSIVYEGIITVTDREIMERFTGLLSAVRDGILSNSKLFIVHSVVIPTEKLKDQLSEVALFNLFENLSAGRKQTSLVSKYQIDSLFEVLIEIMQNLRLYGKQFTNNPDLNDAHSLKKEFKDKYEENYTLQPIPTRIGFLDPEDYAKMQKKNMYHDSFENMKNNDFLFCMFAVQTIEVLMTKSWPILAQSSAYLLEDEGPSKKKKKTEKESENLDELCEISGYTPQEGEIMDKLLPFLVQYASGKHTSLGIYSMKLIVKMLKAFQVVGKDKKEEHQNKQLQDKDGLERGKEVLVSHKKAIIDALFELIANSNVDQNSKEWELLFGISAELVSSEKYLPQEKKWETALTDKQKKKLVLLTIPQMNTILDLIVLTITSKQTYSEDSDDEEEEIMDNFTLKSTGKTEKKSLYVCLKLLEVLVKRAVVFPQIYDMSLKLRVLLLTLIEGNLQKLVVEILTQFYSCFPMNEVVLTEHLNFWLKNISSSSLNVQSKQATILMLIKIISAFSQLAAIDSVEDMDEKSQENDPNNKKMLEKKLELILLPLCVEYVNETNERVKVFLKIAISECLEKTWKLNSAVFVKRILLGTALKLITSQNSQISSRMIGYVIVLLIQDISASGKANIVSTIKKTNNTEWIKIQQSIQNEIMSIVAAENEKLLKKSAKKDENNEKWIKNSKCLTILLEFLLKDNTKSFFKGIDVVGSVISTLLPSFRGDAPLETEIQTLCFKMINQHISGIMSSSEKEQKAGKDQTLKDLDTIQRQVFEFLAFKHNYILEKCNSLTNNEEGQAVVNYSAANLNLLPFRPPVSDEISTIFTNSLKILFDIVKIDAKSTKFLENLLEMANIYSLATPSQEIEQIGSEASGKEQNLTLLDRIKKLSKETGAQQKKVQNFSSPMMYQAWVIEEDQRTLNFLFKFSIFLKVFEFLFSQKQILSVFSSQNAKTFLEKIIYPLVSIEKTQADKKFIRSLNLLDHVQSKSQESDGNIANQIIEKLSALKDRIEGLKSSILSVFEDGSENKNLAISIFHEADALYNEQLGEKKKAMYQKAVADTMGFEKDVQDFKKEKSFVSKIVQKQKKNMGVYVKASSSASKKKKRETFIGSKKNTGASKHSFDRKRKRE